MSDPFGYDETFRRALAKVGEPDPGALTRHNPVRGRYLPRLTWDPTTAMYFADFNAKGSPFRLNDGERAIFRKNGFVVSGRLGADSFAEMYYRIFTRDLPVLVTADSVLHAWHRSYDAVIEELEETYLVESLGAILAGMHGALPGARADYGRGVLAASLEDADYFLAVARSLLSGKQIDTARGGEGRGGEGRVEERVRATLAAVKAESLQRFALFGAPRVMDFTQMKVRGHYANSERLGRYFQAMMWLGRVDLRVAGEIREDTRRQLGAAIVLHDLLRRAGRLGQWADFDRMIQTFVGPTDSMTFAQLGALLGAAGIRHPKEVKGLADLGALQRRIARTRLGAQGVRSHVYASTPFGPDQVTLPRSFTVLGQKFTVDNWATAKLVADSILWKGAKVQRRLISGLDVAFSVLGNDAAAPLLAARIRARGGRRFRDGLPVQHHLLAVRRTLDAQKAAAWRENLYLHWLDTLRALSGPTTDARYPEAMRTEAWARKTLNTQLASWAQLRHDTILYAKQSYTAGVTCYYPAGLVEPRPELWARLAEMADAAAALIQKTPYPTRAANGADLKALKAKQAAFFHSFAAQVRKLHAVATKQLARRALTPAEARMVKDVVQISHGSGFTRYTGWYPTLFYKGREDSGKADFIIGDVHTDVPAPMIGDPGGVVHQAVGRVDLLMMAAKDARGRIAYAGPTFSRYEIVTTGLVRKNDQEWAKDVRARRLTPRPAWTRGYLVP